MTTQAQAPTALAVQQPPTVEDVVQKFADQYHVSAQQMLSTMKCESSLDPDAIGDHGTSYGIAQIHLPAHPDITVEEAEDVQFSSEFMAKEFSLGHASIWSCYRIIYG